MKIKTLITTFFLITTFILSSCKHKQETPPPPPPAKVFGTAIIITGAGARIPQEAALLEHLSKCGMLKDVVFISGASSGALNTVVLNGILSHKYSWEKYKSVLFSLNNDSIFKQNGKKLPVSTEPLRRLIDHIICRQMGYKTIGDLPITSSISMTAFDIRKLALRTYRLSSRKINAETDTTLNLTEILMASTAFPVVFPTARISNASTIPQADYMDGGIGHDHIPINSLLEYQKYSHSEVQRLIIISRKSDMKPNIGSELKALGLKDIKLFDKIGVSPEYLAKESFIRQLRKFTKEYPELSERTYVYIPEFDENFLFLNFDNLQKQYEVTAAWAAKNQPVLLKDYLVGN